MRRAAFLILAAAGVTPATSQTVHYGVRDAQPGWAGPAAIDRGEDGTNAFFYPDGYDPQYGSEGRLPDATDFADGYGCLPIWDGKYGQYVEACNRD